MANIGNQVTTIPFIADTFSGNSSQQSFNLTRAPAGTASVAVFIGTAYQVPASYSLSGTLLTFVSAPTAGTNNITVLHLGNGSATQVPSTGSVSLTSLSSDTYGYINAAFSTANTGSASGSYANSAFAAANTATASGSYANSAFSTANSAFAAANTATASGSYANSGFAVANSSASYANSGFAVANSSASYANSAFLSANNSSGVNLTQNTNITSASSYANAAFTKANTAGAGTVTSVATGNGLSGGTITTSGTLVIACPSLDTVGSYAFVRGNNSRNSAYGENIPGGELAAAAVYYDGTGLAITTGGGGTFSGTWKCMGGPFYGASYNGSVCTLVCRVS